MDATCPFLQAFLCSSPSWVSRSEDPRADWARSQDKYITNIFIIFEGRMCFNKEFIFLFRRGYSVVNNTYWLFPSMNLCCFQLGDCFINSTLTSDMPPPLSPSHPRVGCSKRDLGGSHDIRDSFSH